MSELSHNNNNFSIDTRIYYEDTDTGGVVYHSNYLNYMERARTEWLRALGFEQDQLITDLQTIFAVRSAQIEYLRPARFNDLLQVTASIKELKRSTLTFFQEIFKKNSDGKIELLVEGTIKIVSINSTTFKPKRIPDQLMESLHGH